MSQTRSGLTYRTGYDFTEGLQQDLSGDAILTNKQVEDLLYDEFKSLSQTSGVNVSDGNIAAILAKFKGHEIFKQVSYSTQSKVSHENQYQFDLAPQTTNFSGDYSQQSNSQARNHTEPKLLQEFADRFLFNGSSMIGKLAWVIVVTDRPCCGTCLSGSIQPFAAWCKQAKIGFCVVDLGQTIKNKSWSCQRTVYA